MQAAPEPVTPGRPAQLFCFCCALDETHEDSGHLGPVR